ncbi:MAG: lysyl oxidase family protein [Trueperaceae bacterium]|nr:lysyl oxidase family protein [Trueperaceae bacterium]
MRAGPSPKLVTYLVWGMGLAAWALAVGPAAPREAPAAGEAVALQAGVRTGEALLPDLQVVRPHDLELIGSRAEGDLRLKFTTVIWNAGDGPMEVRGSRNEATGDLEVYQYLHASSGDVRRDRRVGRFDYEHRHGHLHLVSFAQYRLWSLDGDGAPQEVVAENAKVGFCLMDNLVIDEDRAPEGPVYGGCEAEVQGISVGYGDAYLADLFEQDLHVSDVPDGRYRLVNVANPDRALREARYDNNQAAVDLVLREGRVAPVTAR